MPPSPFSHQNLRRGPARGAFPGSAVIGVLTRSSTAAAGRTGAGPLQRGVTGRAALRDVPSGVGRAACGAKSKVQGGRDGNEPFYVQGCGCGGSCDAGTARAGSAGGTTPRAVPAGRGGSTCGTKPKLPGGQNGQQPFYSEGCGCGGGHGSARPVGGGLPRSSPLAVSNAGFGFAEEESDPDAAPSKFAAAPPPSQGCPGPDAFQQLFDKWNSRNMLLHRAVDYAADAAGVCFGVPNSASDQLCADFALEFWNDSDKIELCPTPPMNVSLSRQACNHSSEEVDVMVGLEHGPQFENMFHAGACDATFVSFLRKCWCMLFENFDILEWAICVAIGDKEVAAELKRLLSGEHYILVTCSSVDPPNLVETVIDMVWFRHAPEIDGWLDSFTLGTRDQRLCAVIQGAHVLFHELLHRAATIGDFWLEGAGANSTDIGVQCNPVWLAESVARTGLIMRFARARHAPCCDGKWSDMFFKIGVNHDGGLDCAATELELKP